MVLLIAPLAPHIAEELWRKLGHQDTVVHEDFPVADPAYVVDETVTCVVQVKGKVKARLEVSPSDSEADLEAMALAEPVIVGGAGRGGHPKGDRPGAEAGQHRSRLSGPRGRPSQPPGAVRRWWFATATGTAAGSGRPRPGPRPGSPYGTFAGTFRVPGNPRPSRPFTLNWRRCGDRTEERPVDVGLVIGLVLFLVFVTLGVVVTVRATRAVKRGVERTGAQVRRTVEETTLKAQRDCSPAPSGKSHASGWSCAPPSTSTRAALEAGAQDDPALTEAIALLDQLHEHARQLDGELRR